MKYLILILLSFSAYPCEITYENSDIAAIKDFSDDYVTAIKDQTCDNFADYKEKTNENDKKYKENIEAIARNQGNQIWKIQNRHLIGAALGQCSPDKNTKALVITFAGTGSYNPRAHSLMAELIQCKKFQYMPYKHKKNAHWPIMKYLKAQGSMFKDKNDMIANGPLAYFLKNHELNKQARYFKFASFASEEVEVLGDQSKMGEFVAGGLMGRFPPGSFGTPGINGALECVKQFYSKTKEMGISPRPKLIVMGHSSGGRSAVKFLERLKKREFAIEADLVATIDPVKEAHIVAIETAGKMAADFTTPFVKVDATVPSKVQPERLYKTSNTKKWINFYQTEDEKGLDAGFGIHGSPIVGADDNIFVKGVGYGGHGDIALKYKVNDRIKQEILSLFE